MAKKPSKEIKVAIVGAGIAGLTAAWYLKKRGYTVRIIEEKNHIGGKLGAHLGRVPLRQAGSDSDPIQVNDSKPIPGINDKTSCIEKQDVLDQITANLRNDPPKLPVQASQAVRLSLYMKTPDRSLSYPMPISPVSGQKVDGKGSLEGAQEAYRFDVNHGLGPLHVALYGSQNNDGKTYIKVTDGVYHEHCYHMYLNWYKNFWAMLKDAGIERTEKFSEVNEYYHLFPGTSKIKSRQRTRHNWDNWSDDILSGTASVPDMLLGVYSVLDLVGEPLTQDRYFDRISTHAFLASRWFASEASVRLHEFMLAKAFAVPVYFSSAFAYRKYLQYTMFDPDPLMWTLKKNSYTGLFEPLGKMLVERGDEDIGSCKIEQRTSVASLVRKNGRVSSIRIKKLNQLLPGNGHGEDEPPEEPSDFEPQYVIIATPPAALANIVSDFQHVVPGLSTVRKLNSASTAVLDLHFKDKLSDIPNHHVMLRDSAYGLTFVDNSQIWHDDPNCPPPAEGKDRPTVLSVAVTDFYKIEGMSKRQTIRVILEDLQRFIDFDMSKVDFTRTFLEMNKDDPLFLNEVGSEPWRPNTRTEIPNLFLAGDFVDNEIGVVCVEGAVMSGLLAARAVQAQLRQDEQLPSNDPLIDPIPIQSPDTFPLANSQFLKQLLSPYIPWAKAASRMYEHRRHPERVFSPEDARTDLEDATIAPGRAVQNLTKAVWDTAQWISGTPYRDDD